MHVHTHISSSSSMHAHPSATHTHTHTHTHTYTRTLTHAHAHTRTLTHAHTHTHSLSLLSPSLPLSLSLPLLSLSLSLPPPSLSRPLSSLFCLMQLADFGFACRIGEDSFHESIRGSPLYLAPEMLCEKHYDARADLWSVGVILFEVIFGKAPFYSETYMELMKKITAKYDIKIPTEPSTSKACKDLLQVWFCLPCLFLHVPPSTHGSKRPTLLV